MSSSKIFECLNYWWNCASTILKSFLMVEMTLIVNDVSTFSASLGIHLTDLFISFRFDSAISSFFTDKFYRGMSEKNSAWLHELKPEYKPYSSIPLVSQWFTSFMWLLVIKTVTNQPHWLSTQKYSHINITLTLIEFSCLLFFNFEKAILPPRFIHIAFIEVSVAQSVSAFGC